MNMNRKKRLIVDVDFWLNLSERYFNAETTEEEEEALKRFVVSEQSQAVGIDGRAGNTFEEVRATMSLMSVAKSCHSHSILSSSEAKNGFSSNGKRNGGHASVSKWISAVAAVVLLLLVLKATVRTESDADERGVCVAFVNGEKITDKNEVLSMMRDSWNNINISASEGDVESQLRDMFSVLE